ncbi:ABC-2 type transport system permease protein [Paenibacillus sp. yr247]|uniref:ABC transporter permease subunit n=1 Tax=Paenibacillus sp. yr247 TaxID=1761880 RepID=UPI00088E1CE5|nr:ABC transporter permease subunit [Paenibacillus sp. yr247]SDN75540.1 ABC-2 type transport system permease protein [Paenibacillus sp. yr247]
MHRWRAGYLNELFLLLYRKKVVMFAIFSAILPVLLAISLSALQPILGLIAVSQSFPIEMLTIYTSIWIPLFILTITGDLFPNEVASRTLKLALLRPNSRFQVFGTKIAALGTGIAGILIILGIVTFFCNLFAGTSASFTESFHMMKAYVAAFVSMLALSTLFVFVSQFFKSASSFMVFSLVLYAAAKIAPFLLSSVAAFSPASYTDWHMLWLSQTVSAGKLLTTSLFLLSSCMLFLALGYYKFDRKEV